MTRYSLAAASIALLIVKAKAADGDGTAAWNFLPVTIPTPLSDMSIVSLMTGSETDGAKTRLIITGGCDSPGGNEYVERGQYEGFECSSLTAKAYAFDPLRNNKSQAWNGDFETLTDMPRARYRHASAVIDGEVCVFGGRDVTDTIIAEVDCYNPVAKEWTTPTSLPKKYHSSDLTAHATDDHKVYLIGGYDQTYTALDLVTIVDMTDRSAITYSDGSKLASARGDIDVAVLSGDLYVSGGFTHENGFEAPKSSVEKYNVAADEWSTIDALNEERGDKQLVSVKGKVYAIGGETKVDVSGIVPAGELPELWGGSEVLDTVEVLDVTSAGGKALWKSLADMPSQLFRFAAAEWEFDGEEEGYIFVFGGQVDYNSDCKCFATTDKVMVFDVARATEVVAKDESGTKRILAGFGAFRSFVFSAGGIFFFSMFM